MESETSGPNTLPIQLSHLCTSAVSSGLRHLLSPVVNSTTLLKALHIPLYLQQSLRYRDLQNGVGSFLNAITFVQEPHVLVQEQVALCHYSVRLGNKSIAKVLMPLAKRLKLVVCDTE